MHSPGLSRLESDPTWPQQGTMQLVGLVEETRDLLGVVAIKLQGNAVGVGRDVFVVESGG